MSFSSFSLLATTQGAIFISWCAGCKPAWGFLLSLCQIAVQVETPPLVLNQDTGINQDCHKL